MLKRLLSNILMKIKMSNNRRTDTAYLNRYYDDTGVKFKLIIIHKNIVVLDMLKAELFNFFGNLVYNDFLIKIV